MPSEDPSHDEATEAPREAPSAEETPAGRNARANVKRPKPAPRKPTRSPSYIRSASKSLRREAEKILAKPRHRNRIPEKIAKQIEFSVGEIDRLLPGEDVVALEREAEALDDLLHVHASFARKSALRETLENVGIAIIVALGVRSCLYEPFKIPSGSMMPTLRAGDHIFVNKFAYGVQIPLTTTVIGQDWFDEIERGEVIVFRYPLKESDDFIKRVIALPGDTLRVNGDRRRIELMQAGEDHFEPIERERLPDEKCLAETSPEPIENCTVYLETIGDKSYQVRYRDDLRTTDPSMRTFVVPADHLLVMGDNRNASHDSLAWQVTEDAIAAAGLLSRIDIHDLTGIEGRIEVREGLGETTNNDDARVDRVRYIAERTSPPHELELEVWRPKGPGIDARAVEESLAATTGSTELIGFDLLLDDAIGLGPRERERLIETGEQIGEFHRGEDPVARELVFHSPDDQLVFRLHCGRSRCVRWADLATRMVRVVESWQANPDYDARELLIRESGNPRSTPGRTKVLERYVERRFGPLGAGVRLRAWRTPSESLTVLRDALLGEFGVGPVGAMLAARFDRPVREAAELTDLGSSSSSTGSLITLDAESGWVVVLADEQQAMLAVLECGPKRCKNRQDVVELATAVSGRFAAAAAAPERLADLLGQSDAGSLPEVPVVGTTHYYWDRVQYEGRVLDDGYAIELDVEMNPPDGLAGGLERAKQQLDGDPIPAPQLGDDAWYAAGSSGHQFVFAVSETNLVIRLGCRPGLCASEAIALTLARRAQEKGRDTENFLQKDVTRSKPFVPRGNVKGRAEVIWWPTSRFWRKIE
ncbi:signal peptidase I [Nannocystaceae bacterium ST9]